MSKTGGGVGTNQHQIKGTSQARGSQRGCLADASCLDAMAGERCLMVGGHSVLGEPLPEPAGYDVLREAGKPTPEFFELEQTKGAAQCFHDAIARHSQAHSHGGAVDVHSADEYEHMRLFLTEDGLTGFAIVDKDELVSVFSAQGSGRGRALSVSAVDAGCRRADCFAIPAGVEDTEGFLPRLYRQAGLVEVARVEINEAYDHPPGSMWVSILATVDNPPPVKMFGKDDYEAALSYRDGVLGS